MRIDLEQPDFSNVTNRRLTEEHRSRYTSVNDNERKQNVKKKKQPATQLH